MERGREGAQRDGHLFASLPFSRFLLLKGKNAKIRSTPLHYTSIAVTHFKTRHTINKKMPDASSLLALKGSREKKGRLKDETKELKNALVSSSPLPQRVRSGNHYEKNCEGDD